MAYRYLVVIPAYNEETTIEQVVKLAKRHADVCIVNDASTDATSPIIESIAGVHCIHHQKNTHIAGAILDGMRYALQNNYDFCVTMDAGMSHDPEALPEFKKHSGADVVIGSRSKRVRVPLYRKALSFAGTVAINIALRRNSPVGRRPIIRDATSGYRMYSRRAYTLLLQSQMKSRSFDFHLEALGLPFREGLKIEEVPITYVYSNSSLSWKVVRQCLRTWARLLSERPVRTSAIGIREDTTAA